MTKLNKIKKTFVIEVEETAINGKHTISIGTKQKGFGSQFELYGILQIVTEQLKSTLTLHEEKQNDSDIQ